MECLSSASPYDLRRGAAYEAAVNTAQAVTAGEAAGEAAAATLLGHSHSAVKAGVTKRYIGHLGIDHWKKRVTTRPTSRQKHSIRGSNSRLTKKHLTTKEVDEACRKASADPKSTASRAIGERPS
ncbi:hypothetical protein ACJZ2D_003295 [Fusarium nematophilum]